jgi:two-component system sensor histidine kinase ResE
LIDGTAARPVEREQAAAVIYEESQRLHTMTSALLDLARFEAGQVTLDRDTVDLVSLVERRLTRFQLQAAEAGVDMRFDSEKVDVTISGDEDRLEQLLDNLLSNALAHTPTGGEITVTLTNAPPEVILSVSDTGTGIPAEELSRIFERFYRGDRSRRGPGSGLGLSIAREIVAAHGGTIGVTSTPGGGATFTVRLPHDR